MTLAVPPRDAPGRLARVVSADPRVLRGVAVRCTGLALGAVVLGALHLRHRPATVCPFRALTGLPCPFCGGTTAACRLGHADIRGALAASPLALGLLLCWPLVGVVAPPRWWHRRRLRVAVIVAVLLAAELWQLVRFGVVTV